MPIFYDRIDAGEKLAKKLVKYRPSHPIILGMPRGGVVVAYAIARALQAPLDIIVARKLGAPDQPEFAIGAIAPNDIVVWNEEALSYINLNETIKQQLIATEQKEMQRRLKIYRGNLVPLSLQDKVVIIVDDGIATGQSALAAIKSVRKMKPKKIILAVGVAAADSLTLLQSEVDELICLATPEPFYAVGEWYENFAQVEDQEVIELLQKANIREE